MIILDLGPVRVVKEERRFLAPRLFLGLNVDVANDIIVIDSFGTSLNDFAFSDAFWNIPTTF